MRGGKRTGAGRPKGTFKPKELKAKNHTFKLYDWEVQKVKNFIKSLRNQKSDLSD